MTREDQIQELAADLEENINLWIERDGFMDEPMTDVDDLAEKLVNLGYRKQVEQAKGEWIFNKHQAYGEPLYFCSICVDGASGNGRDNYCPNCGANMKGEKKND